MSEKSALAELKAGDRVQVFDVNGSRMGQPKGGWDGEVVKVGRKLITVKYGYAASVFRLDDGRKNDAYGHQHIKTVEQAAEDLRRGSVVGRLREFGIDLRWDAREISTAKLESMLQVLEATDVP